MKRVVLRDPEGEVRPVDLAGMVVDEVEAEAVRRLRVSEGDTPVIDGNRQGGVGRGRGSLFLLELQTPEVAEIEKGEIESILLDRLDLRLFPRPFLGSFRLLFLRQRGGDHQGKKQKSTEQMLEHGIPPR